VVLITKVGNQLSSMTDLFATVVALLLLAPGRMLDPNTCLAVYAITIIAWDEDTVCLSAIARHVWDDLLFKTGD